MILRKTLYFKISLLNFKISLLNLKVISLYKMSGKNEMSNFISTINSIREILRSPEGITGMDSVNHCAAFYLVRRLDADLCGKMNIESKFAFENFDKDEDGEELDEQKLMEKFYVRGGKDCFVNVLVNKFKFTAM